MDIWRPVVGWEGIYSVSDTGSVRRDLTRSNTIKGRILKCSIDSGGYPRVCLLDGERERWERVHVLVAEAFLSARPAGYEPNHKDGNKTNNRVDNLEWVTRARNIEHARETGLLVAARGEAAGLAKLTETQVREIRASSEGPRALGRKYGVTHATIQKITRGLTWRHV